MKRPEEFHSTDGEYDFLQFLAWIEAGTNVVV